MDGIKYQRIGNEEYYAQELFEQEELTGYYRGNKEGHIRSRGASEGSDEIK